MEIGTILRGISERHLTPEARVLADVTHLRPFAGSLVTLHHPYGFGSFSSEDVRTTFQVGDYPILRPVDFDAKLNDIQDRLDPELRAEMTDYLARRAGAGKRMPTAGLRCHLANLAYNPSDAHDEETRPLELTIGAADWRWNEAFNNRLLDEEGYLHVAAAEGWLNKALWPNMGAVPSYLTAHIIVTGPDYLVLTQRRGNGRIRYFANRWSMSIEENMQGPRIVSRGPNAGYHEGDTDLHACALRGLHEELAIRPDDIDRLNLLGLFAEAPMASCIGIYWVALHLSWAEFCGRARGAPDLETRAVARHGLTTRDLVRLWHMERYVPVMEKGQCVAIHGPEPTPEGFHPAAKARLLAYLIADEERHARGDLPKLLEP
ncbi:MAG: hypothetical protein V1745_01215 [Patescibacteria group bacterium]